MNADEAKRCLGCGYDLRGLPENRCPECGRGFDPNDPMTFGTPRRPSAGGWIAAAVISGTLGPTVGAMSGLLLDWLGKGATAYVTLVPVIVSIGVNLTVLVRSVIAFCAESRFRAGWVAAFLISLLYLLGCFSAISLISVTRHMTE